MGLDMWEGNGREVATTHGITAQARKGRAKAASSDSIARVGMKVRNSGIDMKPSTRVRSGSTLRLSFRL